MEVSIDYSNLTPDVYSMQKRITFLLTILAFQTLQLMMITATEENSSILYFADNKLLSSSDSPYTHHVEPTIAISENGILFAGWKEAYTHNGGGVELVFQGH